MWQIDQNEGNQLGLRSIVEKTLCLVLILFDYSVKLVFLNFEKFVVVNLKYFIQFFIKSGNQGHSQNLQVKLILKLSLVHLIKNWKIYLRLKRNHKFPNRLVNFDFMCITFDWIQWAQPSTSYLCSTKRLFQLFLDTGDRIFSRKL